MPMSLRMRHVLMAGESFGPYQVREKLGEGGMGEVYRARDARLNRDVALKVLPASMTGDPERLARFTREAQVLAALSHPNIGGIHGLEDAGGRQALVLELVEGPTLADRITQGGFRSMRRSASAVRSPKPSRLRTTRGSCIAI